jgi:RND family efflux transporter MFP subunit
MKKPVIVVLLVLALGGGWYALGDKIMASGKKGGQDEGRIVRAEKRAIDFSIEVSGDVTPAFQIDVKPEVSGKIKALHVEPGDVVKAGDLLAEVDDRDLLTEKASVQTEINGAKLDVEKNRRNYARGKELAEQKLVSREVFDNLTSEYEMAENDLVRAQRKLDLVEEKIRKAKVVAPMDGTVLVVPVLEGQVVVAAASVNNGTLLLTIADLSKLLVATHINQVDVARVELNKVVRLRADSLKGAEMTARIYRIAPVASVKNNVKGFEVLALIERPNPLLRPGMTVNMQVPIDSVESAVSVPISAVFKGDGNSKIVYVNKGGHTEKRKVEIGVTNIDFAQILDGVSEGEQILLVEPAKAQKRS